MDHANFGNNNMNIIINHNINMDWNIMDVLN